MRGMDPHTVLGLDPGATPGEATARYRRLAKRWHPDVAGAEGARKMAEINGAYDLLRSGVWQDKKAREHEPAAKPRPAPRRAPAGSWLDPAIRRALGPELLAVLHRGEDVQIVTPVSAWASPSSLLAVTDRRLLWLLDDAVTGRVRSLDLAAVTGAETRLAWPRRRMASLRVARRNGRRPIVFGELRPETAHAIARVLREKVPSP
jgi:hypothetical protein